MKNQFLKISTIICLACLSFSSLAQTKIDSLEQVLKNTNDEKKKLKILKKLVWEAEAFEDFDKYAAYNKRLEKEALRQKDTSSLVSSKDSYAMYFYRKNSLDTAISYLEEMYDLDLAQKKLNLAYRSKAFIGNLNFKKGNFEKAETILRDVLSKTTNDSLKSSRAFICNQMGSMYYYQKLLDSSEVYYVLSKDLYKDLKDTSEMLRPMNNLASIYFLNQKSQKALDVLLEVKEIREALGDKRDLMISNIMLANFYRDTDDYNTSIDYAKKAYALADQINEPSKKASILMTIAEIYKANEDYDNSLDNINKAIELTNNSDLLILGECIVFKSNTLVRLDRADEAIEILEKAIKDLTIEKENDKLQSEFNLYLAKAYMAKENRSKAKELIAKEEGSFQQNPALLDEYYLLKAELFFDEKKYSDAIKYGELSFENFSNRKILKSSHTLANLLSSAYEESGNYKKALYYNKAYNTLGDSINDLDKVRAVTKKTKDLEFNLEKKQLALQKEKDEAILKAQTRQMQTAAAGIGALALLGFGFFWNARRKNKIIAIQNQQLENLNITKDRIFAIIGHDLRKPALSFRGITEKVNYLLQAQDYERLYKLGNTIEKEAHSLHRLTDNLLNWALMQRDVLPYEPQALNLDAVTEDVFEIFTTVAANKNIHLVSNIAAHTKVLADANALHTIIRNLVDNAIKYTPEGGQVEINATTVDGNLNIRIKDTGVGMPSEKIRDIFLLQNEKSVQGTAGEKGTGLGLHLVQELVQLNKGTINAISQLGQGTTFNIVLPSA